MWSLELVCLWCFRSSCLHYCKNYRGCEKGLPLLAWWWGCTLINKYLNGSHSNGFTARAKRQNCNRFWLFSTLHGKKLLMLGLFSHMEFSYTWLLSSAQPCEVILFASYWFRAQRDLVSCPRLHSPTIQKIWITPCMQILCLSPFSVRKRQSEEPYLIQFLPCNDKKEGWRPS